MKMRNRADILDFLKFLQNIKLIIQNDECQTIAYKKNVKQAIQLFSLIFIIVICGIPSLYITFASIIRDTPMKFRERNKLAAIRYAHPVLTTLYLLVLFW